METTKIIRWLYTESIFVGKWYGNGCDRKNLYRFYPLWDTFQSVEAYYLKNNFKYQLLKHEDIILYKEYFNETPINELAFEQTSLDWYILTKSNSCVYSYNELLNDINSDFPNLPSSVDVIEIIEGLKGEGLIYASDNYSELVSIIDIDLIV